MFTVLTVTGEDTELYKATFSVNGVDLEMEVDTGARKSIISERTYGRQFSHIPLQSANVKLRAYNGGQIPVLGQITVTVKYQGQRAVLPLLVIKGHGSTLCGRDWLRQLTLNWAEISFFKEKKCSSVRDLLKKHSDVFHEELGTLKDIKASIIGRLDVTPKFCKHRPLLFAMKERVEIELKRLEEANIISPVKHSDWAAPIVPVVKKDQSLRLCGDYKVSVNQALETDTYPLPRLEELLATLRQEQLQLQDQMEFRLYKNSPNILRFLWRQLKVMWTKQTIPKVWRRAGGVVIPKEKDASNIDQFRPIRMLGAYKHDLAPNPICQKGRKKPACLIPRPSQRFWIHPPFSHLDSLQLLPHPKYHHKPGEKLLPRSAILYPNNRIHNIMAIFGSGNNGWMYHFPSSLHHGNGSDYSSFQVGHGRKTPPVWISLPPIHAYMDDMSTLTSTVACTKHLLGKLQANIACARMKFKPSKSRSISIVKGKLVDQRFHIKDTPISLVSELPVKSLGCWYNVSLKDADQSDQLREDTIKGLVTIDKTSLPGKLKLWCLQFGLLPRMMWPLMVYTIPMIKVEKLERTVSSYIKKWLGLPCCLSNIGLYRHGALELPVSSLTKEFKCTKVTLNMTLTESQDHMIPVAAPRLATERKWIPSEAVQQAKSALRHGDIVGQVQHGRGGFGLGTSRTTWHKATLTRPRGESWLLLR